MFAFCVVSSIVDPMCARATCVGFVDCFHVKLQFRIGSRQKPSLEHLNASCPFVSQRMSNRCAYCKRAFFGQMLLLFRVSRSAYFNLFMELCKSSEKTSTIDCASDSEGLYNLAYDLFHAGPEKLLLRAHKALHTTAQQHVCYRGVSFPSVVALGAFVDKLAANGITEVCGCSLDGYCASLFADPRASPKSVLVSEPRLRKTSSSEGCKSRTVSAL